MKTILSTKKLSASQKKMFQNNTISVTDYNAIEIKSIDFESPKKVGYAAQVGLFVAGGRPRP